MTPRFLSRHSLSLLATGLLLAQPTMAETRYGGFWSVAAATTKVNYGNNSSGFSDNNGLSAPSRQQPGEGHAAGLILSAGQLRPNDRMYVRYHVRPSDEHDIWSITGNMDVFTSRERLLGLFAGAGIGVAGVAWEDHKQDEFDDQSLALQARLGLMVNPKGNWFAELGYRYEKTNLKVNALDDPSTDDDESVLLPQLTLAHNHGPYFGLAFTF